MKVLQLDDVEGVPVFGTLVWKPVRRTLGVSAFGINAYTASDVGDDVVEEHTEQTHEEVYVVVRGHASFTVDGKEIDAPSGTIVFLDDPAQQRHAVAKEAGTTVLAVGGEPGAHETSAWESVFLALPATAAGDYDRARGILREGLEEKDRSAIHFHLARVEALAGNREAALDELARCEPGHRERAREDEAFASIRADARFPAPTSG